MRTTRTASGVIRKTKYTVDDNPAYIKHGEGWKDGGVIELSDDEEESIGAESNAEEPTRANRALAAQDMEKLECWELIVLSDDDEASLDDEWADRMLSDDGEESDEEGDRDKEYCVSEAEVAPDGGRLVDVSGGGRFEEDPEWTPANQTRKQIRRFVIAKRPKPPVRSWMFYAPSAFESVYLLTSFCGKFWYIGSTNNPQTRIRLHNGLVRGVTSKWQGSNIGHITASVMRRPWKMVLLVEGFLCNIISQRFEIQWYRKHPSIKHQSSGDRLSSFLSTLVDLLHANRWKGCPLKVRFFDEIADQIWTNDVQPTPIYRLPPLIVIEDFHGDNTIMPKDWKTDGYKFNPLTILRREVQDFLAFAKYILKGKKHFERCQRRMTKQICWGCNEQISMADGKGEAYSEDNSKSPITYLCSQSDCVAVAHASCASKIHWAAEVPEYGDDADHDIRLPLPSSGKCGACGEVNDWNDYRREVSWRLKATPALQEQMKERIRVETKKQRVAVEKYEEALAEYKLKKEELELNEGHVKAAELVEPRVPPKSATKIRRPVSVDGPTVNHGMSEQDRAIQSALLKMILNQKSHGDIHRPTIIEKIYLGDVICTERFATWANYDIRHLKLLESCPPFSRKRHLQISKKDVRAFFDTNSYPWADIKNHRTAGIKACFKFNDTEWAMEEDKEIRREYGYDSEEWQSIKKRNTKYEALVQLEQIEFARNERVAERKQHREEAKDAAEVRMKENRREKRRLRKLRKLQRRYNWAYGHWERSRPRNNSPPTVPYLYILMEKDMLKKKIKEKMADGKHHRKVVAARKARAKEWVIRERELAEEAKAEKRRRCARALGKEEGKRRHGDKVEARKRDKSCLEAFWHLGRWEWKKATRGGKWCRVSMKAARRKEMAINGKPPTLSVLEMKRAGTWKAPKQPMKPAKRLLGAASEDATNRRQRLAPRPVVPAPVVSKPKPAPSKIIWTILGGTSPSKVIPLLTCPPRVGISVAPDPKRPRVAPVKPPKLLWPPERNIGRYIYPTPSPTPPRIFAPPLPDEEEEEEDTGPSMIVKYDPYYYDLETNPGAADWNWTPPQDSDNDA